MNPNYDAKVKNAMKPAAGWDKSGKTYTPPMEVSNPSLMKETSTKPKVSKSAEKIRVKESNIKNLRDQLLKEQMQTNPDVKSAVAKIKANNPKVSNKELATSAIAQAKYAANLRNIEASRKSQEESNRIKLNKIKEMNK